MFFTLLSAFFFELLIQNLFSISLEGSSHRESTVFNRTVLPVQEDTEVLISVRAKTLYFEVFLPTEQPSKCTTFLLLGTNINHKGLQRTGKEYAEERWIYKDLISKTEK